MTPGAAPNSVEPEIERLVATRQWEQLRDLAAGWSPVEIADLLPRAPKTERVVLFRVLPRRLAAEAFAHLDPPMQDELLRDLGDEETRHVLASLAPDDRAHLLG